MHCTIAVVPRETMRVKMKLQLSGSIANNNNNINNHPHIVTFQQFVTEHYSWLFGKGITHVVF